MDNSYEQAHQLRALAMRVAALEDNVAFLEEWCEEQQDTLDRGVGPAAGRVGCDYEDGAERELSSRAVLRVVDLRDGTGAFGAEHGETDAIVAVIETEHDRRVRQIRVGLNRLRMRLAASLAPAPVPPSPPGRRPAPRPFSARPAGRTAP